MSHQWLAAENFERTNDVIAAINALAIHCQLSLSGTPDPTPQSEVIRAQARLREFFDSFSTLVNELEKDGEAPLLGADARVVALAHRFILTRSVGRPLVLREVTLNQVTQWLRRPQTTSLSRPERSQLIHFLRAIRSLLENNAHADVVGLLGVL